MVKRAISFIVLLFISMQIHANDSTCPDGMLNEIKSTELSSLLNILKNDILGSVPLFCRDNGTPEQLSEQTDAGEKSLNNFVQGLKDIAINKESKSTKKLNSLSEAESLEVVFQVMHFTVMKKIWHLSSQENKDNIMTSIDCSEIGVHRFPELSNSVSIASNESDEKNLKKAKKLCKASSLKELVPFMSKDVLAEALYNLKQLMPQKFDQNLKIICQLLSEPDVILNKDEYKEYAVLNRSVSSVEAFTKWLDGLTQEFDTNFKTAEDKKEADKNIFDQQQVVLEEQKNKYASIIKTNKEKLKLSYEEQSKSNSETGKNEPILVPGMTDVEIIKDNEKYYCKLTDEATKKVSQLYTGYTPNEDSTPPGSKISEIQDQMKNIYDSAQENNSNNDTPDDNYPGYIIKKDDDGNYFYVMNDALKVAYKTYVKKQEENTPKFSQEQLKHIYHLTNHGQALANITTKQMYNSQGTYGGMGGGMMGGYPGMSGGYSGMGGGMIGGGFNSTGESFIYDTYLETLKSNICNAQDAQDLIPYGFVVVKESDKYILEKLSFNSNKTDKILFHALQDKEANDFPVPYPNNPGFVLVKDSSGSVSAKSIDELTSTELQISLSSTFNKDSDSILEYPKGDNGKVAVKLAVKNSLKSIYQKRTTDISLINTLTGDEKKAIANYTGSGFYEYNGCLRSNNCSDRSIIEINHIISGLNKIRNINNSSAEPQTIFRGTSSLPEHVLAQLESPPEDGVELDKGFMSSSGTFSTAAGFSGDIKTKSKDRGHIFVLKTKSCIGISNISVIKHEDEFLCPPGLKFIVTRKAKDSNIYFLEEIIPNAMAN